MNTEGQTNIYCPSFIVSGVVLVGLLVGLLQSFFISTVRYGDSGFTTAMIVDTLPDLDGVGLGGGPASSDVCMFLLPFLKSDVAGLCSAVKVTWARNWSVLYGWNTASCSHCMLVVMELILLWMKGWAIKSWKC